MKKISIFIFLTLCFVVVATDKNLRAETAKTLIHPASRTSTYQELLSRVFEIRGMDRTNLTQEERSEIKAELKMIKSALKSNAKTEGRGGGIYISVGALIIIILLLIIIF